MSLAVAAVILWGSIGLMRESVGMSLMGVPSGIELEQVHEALGGLRGVETVHDLTSGRSARPRPRSLHIWRRRTWPRPTRCSSCCETTIIRNIVSRQIKMRMFDRVNAFLRDLSGLETEGDVAGALGDLARDLGFRYFALSHHVDIQKSAAAIRIHNYPSGWAEWFDEQELGRVDPVHRASRVTCVGFPWCNLEHFITLTARDVTVLKAAQQHGISNGFTVPVHVPGEAPGSVSFAAEPRALLNCDNFTLLQLAGTFAFDAARRIQIMRKPAAAMPRLTDRQRECLMWAARGKSNWEISRILELSPETVRLHLKHASERYGVGKRTLLTVRALFDGAIDFTDVLRP